MDINYFLSIINVYMNSEKNSKLQLDITKISNKLINVKITMQKSDNDATEFTLPYEVFMNENSLNETFHKLKENLVIIDEKNNHDKKTDNCHYSVIISNGRKFLFHNFSLREINDIRNSIYDINYNKQEIRVLFNDEDSAKTSKYRLRESGFTGVTSTILIIVVIVVLIILGLLVYKNFIQ